MHNNNEKIPCPKCNKTKLYYKAVYSDVALLPDNRQEHLSTTIDVLCWVCGFKTQIKTDIIGGNGSEIKSEIKNCPLCNGKPALSINGEAPNLESYVTISCTNKNCGARTIAHPLENGSPRHAIEDWNNGDVYESDGVEQFNRLEAIIKELNNDLEQNG